MAWLDLFSQALHRHGLLVTVDVPLNDEAFDYEAIGAIADTVVVMGYDEHWGASPPGPIASQPWFEDGLDEMLERIPAHKLIAGLGTFGYDWVVGGDEPAEDLGFTDALAHRMHASVDTPDDSFNSTFHYRDARAREHQVWFLDAVSAWNQLHGVRARHLRGVSMWRAGLEDAGFWELLATEHPETVTQSHLEHIPAPSEVVFRGNGELLRVKRAAHDGRRDLTVERGAIVWARYLELPGGFVVERSGSVPRGTPGREPHVLASRHREHLRGAARDRAQRHPAPARSVDGVPDAALFPILGPAGDLYPSGQPGAGRLRRDRCGLPALPGTRSGGLAGGLPPRPQAFRQIAVVVVHRFFHRQFTYVVTLTALAAAVRGRRHRWNELARLGSVTGDGKFVGAA